MENNNKQLKDISLSILDLVPVLSGNTVAQSFRNSLNLAQKAEQFGYKQFWMSEHHNMEGVASSATVVQLCWLVTLQATPKQYVLVLVVSCYPIMRHW